MLLHFLFLSISIVKLNNSSHPVHFVDIRNRGGLSKNEILSLSTLAIFLCLHLLHCRNSAINPGIISSVGFIFEILARYLRLRSSLFSTFAIFSKLSYGEVIIFNEFNCSWTQVNSSPVFHNNHYSWLHAFLSHISLSPVFLNPTCQGFILPLFCQTSLHSRTTIVTKVFMATKLLLRSASFA
jgi:hypothetical protein